MNNHRKIIINTLVSAFMVTFILFLACTQFTSCSGRTKEKSDPVDTLAKLTDSIKILYDYTENKMPYKLTFLEFGSKNCIPCKMMESVLDSVKAAPGSAVNVVFYNVREKNNKVMVKYYGINYIPVQILLDAKGNECFRHVGYFPYDSLAFELKKHNAIN